MDDIKQHYGEMALQLLLIFFIANSTTTVVHVYMRYALSVFGKVWLGNPKTGKRTFDNDYWPTVAVTLRPSLFRPPGLAWPGGLYILLLYFLSFLPELIYENWQIRPPPLLHQQ